MPKRIAIVEDEAELAALIDYNLTRNGYQTQVLNGAESTLKTLESARPDLILLDIMLPEMDGFELCRQIRQSQALARTPVLFLTARSDEVDRVLGLEIGGDDYMTKPFTPRGLFQRDREVTLTSTEFNLLEFFLTHPGRAYSRDQLLEAVWGEQRYVTPRTVDVHIRRLREQIEEQPESPRNLTTVRGFGYRFEDSAE